jgi:hypothetical protein
VSLLLLDGRIQLYVSLLAAVALSVTTKLGSNAGLHLNLTLAVAFGVFFYRDIFPFATYTWPVQDAAEGPILYAKLVALTLAAVVIPVVTPRTYIPVDPRVRPQSQAYFLDTHNRCSIPCRSQIPSRRRRRSRLFFLASWTPSSGWHTSFRISRTTASRPLQTRTMLRT